VIDAESAFQGRETLLLIEDEREVRDLAVMALQRDGYTVITAADGPAALRAAEAPGKTLDLVVSDVVLPGASGPETVAKLRERFPDVGVLYISGYPEDRIDASEFKRSAVGFLSKPFKPSELSRAVRILLDDLAQAGLRRAARL
jgi:CheY-like chemotaxis protein